LSFRQPGRRSETVLTDSRCSLGASAASISRVALQTAAGSGQRISHRMPIMWLHALTRMVHAGCRQPGWQEWCIICLLLMQQHAICISTQHAWCHAVLCIRTMLSRSSSLHMRKRLSKRSAGQQQPHHVHPDMGTANPALPDLQPHLTLMAWTIPDPRNLAHSWQRLGKLSTYPS
jgi:hypothetical protein